MQLRSRSKEVDVDRTDTFQQSASAFPGKRPNRIKDLMYILRLKKQEKISCEWAGRAQQTANKRKN